MSVEGFCLDSPFELSDSVPPKGCVILQEITRDQILQNRVQILLYNARQSHLESFYCYILFLLVPAPVELFLKISFSPWWSNYVELPSFSGSSNVSV